MGWLDHDRLGFNYRLSDIACALGLAQLERLDEMLAGRARVATLYREALGGVEGLELPCPDAGGNRRGWFVFVVQLPRGVDRDARRARARRARDPEQAVLPGGAPDDATTASSSVTARASSRSARTSPRARSRCRSSRR